MKSQSHLVEIKKEFSICHRHDGIELIRSDQSSMRYTKKPCLISNMLALSCNVYFYNTEHSFLQSNEFNARSCGFESSHHAVGKTIFKATTKNYADKIAENNNKVLSQKKKVFFEEEILLADGSMLQGISIKMPLFIDSKLNGVFGCTIVSGRDNLFDSLNKLMILGLLSSSEHDKFSNSEKSIYLTNREKECVELTILGKSAREISLILGVTKRTVEFYLANIKSKFDVIKKSDLIEKAREYFS